MGVTGKTKNTVRGTNAPLSASACIGKRVKMFYDTQCPKCHKRVSWSGKIQDQVTCSCGETFAFSQIDVDAVESFRRFLNDYRNRVSDQVKEHKGIC